MPGALSAASPHVLFNCDAVRREGVAQNLDGRMRVGLATHEDVQRRIAAFRPCVDRDMRFRQYRNTRDAAVGRKVMQVNVQQRCPGTVDGFAKRHLNMLKFVQARATVDIDNQMYACITDAVTNNEVVFACITFCYRGYVVKLRCVFKCLRLGQFFKPSAKQPARIYAAPGKNQEARCNPHLTLDARDFFAHFVRVIYCSQKRKRVEPPALALGRVPTVYLYNPFFRS